MDNSEPPDSLSGQVVLGRLSLPRGVLAALARIAAARGMTPLQLVREIVVAWVLGQGPG